MVAEQQEAGKVKTRTDWKRVFSMMAVLLCDQITENDRLKARIAELERKLRKGVRRG